MIIFGVRRFGFVDEVEGLGVVATTFAHVMFIPLIPMSTHLMLDDERGVALPLSMKSVLVGWIRSALFWSAVCCWASVLATFGLSCLLALPLTAVYFGMPSLVRKASPARAEELRRLVF